RLPGMTMLPLSALMTFVPMSVALFVVYQQRGASEVLAMLKREANSVTSNAARWYVTALVFMPVVCVLEFGVLRATGSALPALQVAPGEAIFLFAAFFVGAIGEEVGWQGYAYPFLRARHTALSAASVLGVIWALWHVIPFAQLGHNAHWIFWHGLCAVALRIIIVWLFENAQQRVLIAVLFHTMSNLSWAVFPVAGSYYDPFVAFVILAAAVGLIVFLWGPATLSRFRYRRQLKPDGMQFA
ncbi:MAG: CPBP family intramembrane glutamic endopeptidase, partial [Gemmatimonadaceae bacterium]